MLRELVLFSVESEAVLQSLGLDRDETEKIRIERSLLIVDDYIVVDRPDRTCRINKKDFKLVKSIKNKIKNDQLIITRADKGNCLTMLSKIDYDHKVESFIRDNGIVKKNININSFITQLKNIFKEVSHIMDTSLKSMLTPRQQLFSRLYGLLKIHKSND